MWVQVGAATALLGGMLGVWLLVAWLGVGGPGVPGDEPAIGVRLRRATESATIGSGGGLRIGVLGAGSDAFGSPVRVTLEAAGWRIESARRSPQSLGPAGAPLIVEPDAGSPMTLFGADAPLADSLRLRARSDVAPAAFDVIADVPLEDYVAGVVGAETYDGWHEEALKAQAVAARSYAISERIRARAGRRPHDIEVGQAAQALELDPRRDARLAADATRGVVLTSAGRVLRAYYASTCGGRPASASDTWEGPANRAAPLQASDRRAYCQDSPTYRWRIERATAELSARLAAWGRDHGHDVADLGVLRRAEAIERNVAGRPTRYALRDTGGGRFRLWAESLRLGCNHPIGGRRPEVRVRSNDVSMRIDGPVVTIEGRGFGHGVGLCQFGAAELAERGELWPAILGVYYPGASLERAYE